MISIKDIVSLVIHAINHKVIAITNYDQTAVGKISYFIIIDTEISF